jgi:hypothetical protein
VIRIACLGGGAVLLAMLVAGAATSRTPAHAVSYGQRVPDGMCRAYAAYLQRGNPSIELADRVCPAA